MKNVWQINYWTIGGFEGAKPAARALTEAKKMGWIPLLATVGRSVLFFDLAAATPGRKRTVAFGSDVPSLDDILSLVGRDR